MQRDLNDFLDNLQNQLNGDFYEEVLIGGKDDTRRAKGVLDKEVPECFDNSLGESER